MGGARGLVTPGRSRAYPLMASSLRAWPVDVFVDPLLACHTVFRGIKTSKSWNCNDK